MKYYKEKSSLYLFILLVFPMSLYFFSDDKSLLMYFLFLFIPLVAFSSRSYLIRDETLKTPTKYIDINSILKIERRKFNIKSKYFSFDKIVLTFDENETVKISPKEEQDFIKHLLSINPNIEVKI
jgi:hypothetical protein